MWPLRVLRTARLQPALIAFLAQGCAQVLLVRVVLCDFFIPELIICVLSHIRSFSELRCVGIASQRGDGRGLFGFAALGRIVYKCRFECHGLHAYYML